MIFRARSRQLSRSRHGFLKWVCCEGVNLLLACGECCEGARHMRLSTYGHWMVKVGDREWEHNDGVLLITGK